jgi:hypothetical protein
MAVVLLAMGGYGSYLGWQIRTSDDGVSDCGSSVVTKQMQSSNSSSSSSSSSSGSSGSGRFAPQRMGSVTAAVQL